MKAYNKMFWLHAVTPIHVGVGQGVGFVDLPIMREKVTHWPMVPGSVIKGVLRDYFTSRQVKGIVQAFGKESGGENQAGSLVLTDARLVLMPVRSLYGTFAYVTSPLALLRLRRDLASVYGKEIPPEIDDPIAGHLYVPHGSQLAVENKVFLEELDFTIQEEKKVKEWAQFFSQVLFPREDRWKNIFEERMAVVANEVFDYLCETSTEIQARIKMNHERKTVEQGALWYEESLPAEAVLAGVTWCDRVYGGEMTAEELMQTFCPQELNLQIGGHATVGKGQVRCLFTARG